MEVIINDNDVLAIIIRNWLQPDYAQDLCERLIQEIPWIEGQINLSGKIINIPRAMFFLGDDGIKVYNYSNLSFTVQPWRTEVETIRNNISNDVILRQILGVDLLYNSCLLNYYRDGNDKIDYHSDREALGPKNEVVTISLGGTRTFIFKSKTKGSDGKYITIRTKLYNGDLVLMAGKCQELWTHSIPKEQTSESRISLTYRLINKQ